MHRERLPAHAVRDLIGIARALYFAWQAQGIATDRLDQLVQAGRDLRDALELSLRTEPDTIGHRAAWDKAERATAALCALVAADEPMRPMVEAAVKRASGS